MPMVEVSNGGTLENYVTITGQESSNNPTITNIESGNILVILVYSYAAFTVSSGGVILGQLSGYHAGQTDATVYLVLATSNSVSLSLSNKGAYFSYGKLY